MKKLFLHIGCEKTGTTTLQSFLSHNETALNAEEFTYFCDLDKPYFSSPGHFPIAGAFLKKPDFVPVAKQNPMSVIFNALKADLFKNDKHVVLSCEHLSSRLKEKDIRKLSFLSDYRDVKIICYIRRQDAFSLSAYSTRILNGSRIPFNLNHTLFDRYFNFKKVLKPWARVFGKKNILVRVYDRNKLDQGDICADFLGAIGIHDQRHFEFVANENISLDAKSLETLRLINFYLPQFEEAERPAYDRAQEIRFNIRPFLPKGDPLNTLLTNKERHIILQRYKRTNHWVEREFMKTNALSDWYHVDTSEKRTAEIKPSTTELSRILMQYPDDFKLRVTQDNCERIQLIKQFYRSLKRNLLLRLPI